MLALLIAFHRPVVSFVAGYGLEEYKKDIEGLLKPETDKVHGFLQETTIRAGIAHEDLTKLREQVEDNYDKIARVAVT